ncbi:MAG: PhzF family phenazine biosynthesis protein [Candidatus Izemoplasma sp.]|nr:PhzF family phenazine biosynthesis protein [Candidatus Izemoplasma sp.]
MTIFHATAFPKTKDGGNKAGVVYPADDLSKAEMQAIAKELNYSETAFVLNSRLADFKVWFFTPTEQVDLCGHATIATFNMLRDKGVIAPGMYTQQTEVGILKLDVHEDEVYMQQKNPLFGETVSNRVIRHCFEEKDFIKDKNKIQIVSTGLREIFVPIKDVKTMNQLTPKFKKMTQVANQYRVIGLHLFSFDENGQLYGRNFAPGVGINEESATGTSNGALACYLYRYRDDKKTEYSLYQGFSMNLPSEIKVKLEIDHRQDIKTVWVGGKAIKLKEELR